MFDSLYGADEDEHGVEYRWPLFKSHTVVDFINSGITAHRAYTLIPLYDFNDPTKLFPDGEYEIKFEYDVTATGKTFTKSYDLTITSDKPTIRYTENVTIGGTDYVRVRYNETNLSYALITNKYYQILSDSKGQYIDVPTKDFVSKNKIFIESTNKAGAKLNSITHVNDEWRLSVSNGNLINTNDFSATVTEASTSKDTFKTSFALDFVKGTKPTTITGDFAISLLLPEAYDLETLKVISDSKTLNYEIDGRYILFTTSTASFILEANNLAPDPGPDPKPDPEPEPEPKKGCGGSVIATSSILAIVSALGVSLLVLRKKKIGK